MQSNKIVVILANDGVSGLAVSYGKNINTVYLNSHLYNEFVVRPNFTLGAGQTMFVTFTQGALSTKPLLLAARQTTKQNSTQQVVDGTSSTIEQVPDNGWEYYMQLPDVILKNVGEWKFSLTIAELPVDVNYKGTVAAVANLPSSGNSVGDTYYVTGATSYYYWSGTAWAMLTIAALSTSDIGTFTVNASVAGDIGGTATDLDIVALYSFVVNVVDNLSDYLPKIGDNGNWWIWNSTAKGYVDTNINAEGVQVFTTGTPLKVTDTTTIAVGALLPIDKNIHANDLVISYTVQSVGGGRIYRTGLGRILGYVDDTTINVSWVGYITGEQGAQGEKGDKGDTGATGAQGAKGADGVGIANVSQEVVTGGTKVTITLTNGTSSSFIVYNGTADNITNLEFPHGDAVVTYDNTDGLHIHGNCRITLNGTNYDVPMDVEVPQTAGDGLTEDATSDAKGAVFKVDETVVRTNKANQIINGNVTIGGNVTVNGTVTSVSSENLKVKDKLIVVADGNTVTLTSPAGLLAPKYDGTNSGALVFDGTGTAYVGDVVLTADGDIDVSKSDLQPLVTRGTLADGKLVKWNAAKLRLEDTGIAADQVATKADLGATSNFIYKLNYESATIPTIGQVLTLTNANFSRTPVVGDVFALMEVVNVSDTYYNNMEVLTVGDTTCTAKIMSFTDITSCKVTKVTAATATQQAYVKNADGTQGMANVGGTADDDIATVKQVNATEPYHITLTGYTGTVTQEQYNKLKADDRSYIIFSNDDIVLTKGKQGLGYYASTGIAQWALTINASLSYTCAVINIENTANKKTSITGDGNDTDYPTTKAVVDYVAENVGIQVVTATYDGDDITVTEAQRIILFGDEDVLLKYSDGIGSTIYAHRTYKTSQRVDFEYAKDAGANPVNIIILSLTSTSLVFTERSATPETVLHKTNNLSDSSTNTQYPSAKAVVDYVKANAGGEAYHVELTGTAGATGTLTDEQMTGMLNDTDSYVLLSSGTTTYKLCRTFQNATQLLYTVVVAETETRVVITIATKAWTVANPITFEKLVNKTNTLSSSSTTTQYPNAKATYDYGQTVLTAAKSYADSILGAEQAWLQKIDTGEGV